MPNIVKYPGGKEKELDIIHAHIPTRFAAYYEPFVGGGSVYLSMDAGHYFINDKSEDLIKLYQMIHDQNNEFFNILGCVNAAWKSIEQWHLNHDLLEIYECYKKTYTVDSVQAATDLKCLKKIFWAIF